MKLPPIHEDIRYAETIDKSFYTSAHWYEQSKEKIFEKTWHWLGDLRSMNLSAKSYYPTTLLDKYIDEPLLITSDKEEQLRCLSNVCTHRGFLLKDHPGKARNIVCQYHGRQFDLDGTMTRMPEFKEAENFPRPCDHLHQLPLERWNQFLFTSIDPAFQWSEIAKVLDEKVGFLPIEQFRFAPEYTKEYLVHANWAVYCDNYLEGFHIPFVHHDLNDMLDYGSYSTELFKYCNVQIGYADEGTESFDLPKGHPEYGKDVTAYYFWLFPNMMLNFYRYGLQINIVKPIAVDRCKVSFLFYLHDEEHFRSMDAEVFSAKVEREDEYVVEGVQKGFKSRFYQNGRYSPTRETGVHHFHRLAHEFLHNH